jgi:AcrR family transcriptional regulator
MSLADRRAMIVDAVIPLLIEHGTALTSRQIAEAAGIAEGTIFRAFGDKDSLIEAAIDTYLDPTPLRAKLAAIDPAQPLEVKVRQVLELLQERFHGVFTLMAVLGRSGRPPLPSGTSRAEYGTTVARVLQPDLERLNCPPETIAPLIRLVAFSTSMRGLNEAHPFELDELVHFVLYGIAGRPPCDVSTA